jgi:predicted lipoprotein with Yx(FWY)xxD motif
MISKRSRGLLQATLVLGGLALVSACGTTVASTGTAHVAVTTSGSAGRSSGSVGPSGSARPSGSVGPVAVRTRSGPMGTYLTDAKGRSLYLFKADTNGTSTCRAQCTAFWPPLTTTGTPHAGPGVTAGLLGTTTRSDGRKQVTYNKSPLYRFAEDQKPGDAKGQGLNNFGALWWLVTPSGNAITASGPTSGSGSPSGTASPSGTRSAPTHSPSAKPSRRGY